MQGQGHARDSRQLTSESAEDQKIAVRYLTDLANRSRRQRCSELAAIIGRSSFQNVGRAVGLDARIRAETGPKRRRGTSLQTAPFTETKHSSETRSRCSQRYCTVA